MQKHQQRRRVILQRPDEPVPLGVLQRGAEAGEAEGGAHEREGARGREDRVGADLEERACASRAGAERSVSRLHVRMDSKSRNRTEQEHLV